MNDLSKELFAIGLTGVQPSDFSRHSQVVPLVGVVCVRPDAIRAASGDDCQCRGCREFVPGGSMFCYPSGNVCASCHELRQDAGVTREDFGASPRET